MNIKKIAELMKAQNGNQSIKQSDMLWYLVKRVDDMDERIDNIVKSCVTKEDCNNKHINNNSGKAQAISVIAICVSALFSIFNLFLMMGGK
jgi:hypothetical protein